MILQSAPLEKELISHIPLTEAMVEGDVLQWAKRKWHTTGWLGKLLLIIILLALAVFMFFQALVSLDDAYSLIVKWNLTEKISMLGGNEMTSASYFYIELILAVAIVVILVAIAVVVVINWAEVKTGRENEKRRYLEFVVTGIVQENDQLRKDCQDKGIVPLAGKIVTRSGMVAKLDSYRHVTPPTGSWKECLEHYEKYLK